MGVQTLHDTGSEYPISPRMDGGVYGTGIADAVCGGVGDEFALNYTSDSLTIQFNAGSQCIIGGAFFRVMSLTAVTLQANSTIYLCANINLSNANGSRGSFVQRTASNMQSQNLNGSGTQRDLLLYVITTGANGVAGVTDRRYIRTDGTIDLAKDGNIESSVAIGSGDNILIYDASASKISKSSIAFGNNASQFLANNGTWQSMPSHSHGNINNNGDITTSVQIASGDRLVINDESASRLNNSSITFGTNASQYLANNGTWQNIPVPTIPFGIGAVYTVDYRKVLNFSWTAPVDCWITAVHCATYNGIHINGTRIWGSSDGSYTVPTLFPLKAGQTVSMGQAQWQLDQNDDLGITAYRAV